MVSGWEVVRSLYYTREVEEEEEEKEREIKGRNRGRIVGSIIGSSGLYAGGPNRTRSKQKVASAGTRGGGQWSRIKLEERKCVTSLHASGLANCDTFSFSR